MARIWGLGSDQKGRLLWFCPRRAIGEEFVWVLAANIQDGERDSVSGLEKHGWI